MIPKKELMKALYEERKSKGLHKVSLWMTRDQEVQVRKYLDSLNEFEATKIGHGWDYIVLTADEKQILKPYLNGIRGIKND